MLSVVNCATGTVWYASMYLYLSVSQIFYLCSILLLGSLSRGEGKVTQCYRITVVSSTYLLSGF